MLHQQNTPFILGNVYDAHSALIFEKLGYQAIGTSSAAIASSLGLEDGEKIHFSQLIEVIKSIISKVKLPLTVDMEGGYSRDINTICSNIHILAKLGVVGINLEDSVVNDKRKIINISDFTDTVKQVKRYIDTNNIQIFLNIRTDFYIMELNNPLENTLERIRLYEQIGIDGIFVPCVIDIDDIKQIVSATKVPINVMNMPNLPNFNTLTDIGVKRISLGPFAYNAMMDFLEKKAQKIINSKALDTLFSNE